MVTGYTAPVVDGKITEFKEFALSCARAFGALITMRDEPMDAPIPDEIKPSTYHSERLAESRVRLGELNGMSDAECEEASTEAYTAEMAERQEAERRAIDENTRVRSMLSKVLAWTPPTEDHERMKGFMIEQLQMSIYKPYERGECTKLDAAQWRAQEIAKAEHDIQYHGEQQRLEIERAQGRSEWLKSLRASLT